MVAPPIDPYADPSYADPYANVPRAPSQERWDAMSEAERREVLANLTAGVVLPRPQVPRAPSQERWDAMSETERQEVLASLPSEIPRSHLPEGDAHSIPKIRARETLREYFRRQGRQVYLASELAVYYPEEDMFAPDLMAVLDVDPHKREHWTVTHENRGLDFVMEILVSGSRRKDLKDNVERYARVGIPEYFVFMPRKSRLIGYVLAHDGSYKAIMPQGGFWPSKVLGLELALDGDRLRFCHGTAPLPDAGELIDRLSAMVDNSVASAEEAAHRAEEAKQRADGFAAKLRELGIDPDAL